MSGRPIYLRQLHADAGLLADRRTKRSGAAIRITWAMKSPSDQEQARQNQHSGCRPSGCHGSSGRPGGRGTADLMPQLAGTLGLMPQIDGTCLTCDGNGHHALLRIARSFHTRRSD